MRILATSDLHHRRDWYDWVLREASKYDVVVIAGDHLDMFEYVYPQIEFLGRWISEINKIGVPLLTCCGNHDWNQYPLAKIIRQPGPNEVPLGGFVTQACLHERWMDLLPEVNPNCVVSGMVRIFPELGNLIVTSLFFEPDHPRINSDLLEEGAALRRKFIPAPPWIVLHHQPPRGIIGRREQASENFREQIELFQPKLVFCGHDHRSPLKNNTCHDLVGLTHVFNSGHNTKNNYPCHIIIDTAMMNYQWK